MKSPHDQLTLPTYQEELKQIQSFLVRDGALALLFIDASRMNKIEQSFGREVYRKVLKSLTDLILGLKGSEIRQSDLVTLYGVEGEQFLIFLSRKREGRQFHSSNLEGLVDRIVTLINTGMAKTVSSYLKAQPRIAVGHAIIIHNPLIQEERQIYKLIEDAKIMSQYQQLRQSMRNKEKVQELIIKEEIRTHFQPIVQLTDFHVLGYEALSRGPKDTEYESPYHLFGTAAEAGLAFELDRLCRRKAFLNARHLQGEHRLFINCLPAAIHDPGFKGEGLDALLQKTNLNPARVVMEISEKDAIENYVLFRSAADYYTDLGFAIAVDDTGSGHSSLETVVELKPQFLKLDISLVRGIHKNIIKQELLRAILSLSRSMNSTVIAEGIETEEELDMLLSLGVSFGQGFLIGKPMAEFVVPQKR
jgi:EAL domain-containing protein (putative c-di-GMP-specific phosphodiesterase class I)